MELCSSVLQTEVDSVPLISGQEAVTAFLPHRPPFVLVDTLLHCNDSEAIGQFTIPNSEHPLVVANTFQEPGLLEHQAQVAGLQAGYSASRKGHQPRMGYLVGFRAVEIHRLAQSGEMLTTTVRTLTNLGNLTTIIAETYSGSIHHATTEFTVMLESD